MKFLANAAWVLLLLSVSVLVGCASPTQSAQPEGGELSGPWLNASTFTGAYALLPWEHYRLPGKQATLYSSEPFQGRPALKAQANSSASMLRRKLRVEPEALGVVRFSWLVESQMAQADLGDADADDSAVRVVLVFEGDREKFSQRNAMLSELALLLTGEPLPYATLMYAWCPTCEKGQIITNARTDRVRTLVLEGGNVGLGQWKDYARDIRADYLNAFGEPPGALIAIGVMTDSDNTRGNVVSWYGPIELQRPLPP